MRLWELVSSADYLNRLLPTFDEVSYGLPRLAAAGYVETERDPAGELRLRATAAAVSLRRTIDRQRHRDLLTSFTEAVGARSFPEAEPAPDRSLGRLTGLAEADFNLAIRRHAAFVRHWGKPLIAASRLVVRLLARQTR